MENLLKKFRDLEINDPENNFTIPRHGRRDLTYQKSQWTNSRVTS